MTEAMREVEANWKFCQPQAEDWKRTVARQVALAVEKWLADQLHRPGTAARQWLIDLYKENQLVKGTIELAGEVVALRLLTMPFLNVFARQNHVSPPPCAKALGPLVGTKDYTELPLLGGQVGVYVSSKSDFDWLIGRQ